MVSNHLFSRSCPVGLPSNDILRRDLNDKFGVPENEIATIEADIVKRDPHSALSYRQSYFQNMPLPPPRPLLCGKPQPSPKPKLGPSYTTRTRPLKLRPRQILCSNCKQDCSKKNTTKRKLLTNGGNLPKKKSRLDPLKKHAPHGLKKRQIHSLKKTLKISYATPQGKDHVTISPRSSGNDKRVNNTQPNGKKVNSIPKGAKHTKQENGKPQIGEEKKKMVVNGFHHNIKKPKHVHSIGSATTLHPKQEFTTLKVSVEKEKENENSLSAVAAKEVLTNSLKVHLVEDLFVPCSKGRLSDTSSESSYSSSVSSKRSRKSTGMAPSDFLKQETNDLDREIEFKDLPPDRSDILSSSNENLQPRKVPPLNLKIHKKNVTKYRLQDGRTMCLGDIVWGKIIGFPWWPGRISQIVVSRRDNGAVLQQEAQIRWLGATTISHMPLEKLYPFLPYFKERYNKKRRGVYKNAISEAMEEAKSVSTEVRELNTMFETSQIC